MRIMGAHRGEPHPSLAYRHGVMKMALPDCTPSPLGVGFAQAAPDQQQQRWQKILGGARARQTKKIDGIGLGFTASTLSPGLRRTASPLSTLYPSEPHAYAKLWKHQSAQPGADR